MRNELNLLKKKDREDKERKDGTRETRKRAYVAKGKEETRKRQKIN